jgi:uncharacterized protein YcfJ
MNESQNDSRNPNRANNPWKIGAFATAGAVLLLVAAGFTFAAFNSSRTSTEQPETVSQAAPRAVTTQPTAAPAPTVTAQGRENCDQYRVDAQRDNMRVAKDGAIGAAVGAGTGAAGGAIADGGSGAGKGAGIGAVVGAVAGGAYGMTQENARLADAERAYQDCLDRNF